MNDLDQSIDRLHHTLRERGGLEYRLGLMTFLLSEHRRITGTRQEPTPAPLPDRRAFRRDVHRPGRHLIQEAI